jgi:hypothetical protein
VERGFEICKGTVREEIFKKTIYAEFYILYLNKE